MKFVYFLILSIYIFSAQIFGETKEDFLKILTPILKTYPSEDIEFAISSDKRFLTIRIKGKTKKIFNISYFQTQENLKKALKELNEEKKLESIFFEESFCQTLLSFSELEEFKKVDLQLKNYLNKDSTPEGDFLGEGSILNPFNLFSKLTGSLFPGHLKDIENLPIEHPLKWVEFFYNSVQKITDIAVFFPEKIIMTLFDSIFGNATWNLLPQDVKVKTIYDAILGKVQEDNELTSHIIPEYARCYNEDQNHERCKKYLAKFDQVINDVIKKNISEMDFNPIANRIVFSKQVRKALGELAIENVLISQLNIDEKNINNDSIKFHAQNILVDYNTCFIDNADNEYEIQRCDKKFSSTVMYRVGKEILDLIIDQNISCDFEENTALQIKKSAINTYNSCSLNNYFPLIENKESQTSSGELQKNIKSCIFQGILESVEKTVQSKVKQALTENMTKIPNGKYKELMNKGQQYYDECISKQFKNDFKSLKSLESELFQRGIKECSSVITEKLAKDITYELIINNEEFKSIFPETIRNSKANHIIENGFNVCLEDQFEPEPEPEKCSEATILYTKKEGIKYVLDKTLKDEKMDNKKRSEILDDFDDCYKSHFTIELIKTKSINLKKEILPTCQNLPPKCFRNKSHEVCNPTPLNVSEQNLGQCLINGIANISYHLARSKIEDQVKKALPDNNISIPNSKMEEWQNEIKKCFFRNLICTENELKDEKSFELCAKDKKIATIQKDKDQIEKKCTNQITKKITAFLAPQVLKEEIFTNLEDTELLKLKRDSKKYQGSKMATLIEEEIDRVSQQTTKLKNEVNNQAQEQLSQLLQNSDLDSNDIKLKATQITIKNLLEQKIYDLLPQKEHAGSRKMLFDSLYNNQLLKNIKEYSKKSDTEFSNFLDQFKKKANIIIGSEVIKIKINDSLPINQRGKLKTKAIQKWKDCISNSKNSDICTYNITKYITGEVSNIIISENLNHIKKVDDLFNGPLIFLKAHFEKDKDQYIKKITNPVKNSSRKIIDECLNQISKDQSLYLYGKSTESCISLGIINTYLGSINVVHNEINKLTPKIIPESIRIKMAAAKKKNLTCFLKIKNNISSGKSTQDFIENHLKENTDYKNVTKEADECISNLTFI